VRKTYRILAALVALEVLIQAAAVAWAIFGLGKWIDEGNTFNKTMLECRDCPWHFPEERGFMVHGLNGMIVIPVLALALLVVSFFVKDKVLLRWSGLVFALVMVQSQVLPFVGREYPVFGGLHGLNSLLLFSAAPVPRRKSAQPAAVPEPALAA
jgi:hypothetical protein